MHLFRKEAGFGASSCFCGAVTLQTGADSDSGGGAVAAAAATAARRAALAPAGPSLQSLKAPLARGLEREAGAQLFSTRIGPEGADVTRLLGALLGGDDAPPTAWEQLTVGRVHWQGLLGARFENRNEEGRSTESQTERVLCSPKLKPGEPTGNLEVAKHRSSTFRASPGRAPTSLGW